MTTLCRILAIMVFLGSGILQAQTPPGSSEETTDEPAETEKEKKKEWKLKAPKVSGFVQVFYKDAWDTSNDGVVDASLFRVQRARISFKGEITPRVSYEVEVDPRSPEIKGVMRDAFIRFRVIPHHQIRVGQQKTQFGYENRVSSSRLYTVLRSELSDSLSRGINLRDIGIGVIGSVPLSERFRIEDAITVVNGAGLNVQDDNNTAKNIFGRVGLRYKAGDFVVRLGVSGAKGDMLELGDSPTAIDDHVIDFTRTGMDFEIDHRLFFLNAEYVKGEDDVPELIFPTPEPAEVVDRKGSYVLAGIKTRWKIGPVVRYDTLDDDFRRWTVGGYYGAPSDVIRVLVNFEKREQRDGFRADDKLYVWLQVRF